MDALADERTAIRCRRPRGCGDRAAGAIGSAVASRFARAGAHVTGLDVRPGDGIIGCDILDETAIARVLTGVTAGASIMVDGGDRPG